MSLSNGFCCAGVTVGYGQMGVNVLSLGDFSLCCAGRTNVAGAGMRRSDHEQREVTRGCRGRSTPLVAVQYVAEGDTNPFRVKDTG